MNFEAVVNIIAPEAKALCLLDCMQVPAMGDLELLTCCFPKKAGRI